MRNDYRHRYPRFQPGNFDVKRQTGGESDGESSQVWSYGAAGGYCVGEAARSVAYTWRLDV